MPRNFKTHSERDGTCKQILLERLSSRSLGTRSVIRLPDELFEMKCADAPDSRANSAANS